MRRGAESDGAFSLSTPDSPATAPLISAGGGVEYLVSITYGGADVSVILDTGSSDTWLVQSGFSCVDASGAAQAEAACGFGPLYNGSFGAGEKIADQNFNITYGDGEFVTGDMGYKDVTIAGLTASHQEVALGTYAYWNGDSISSGLLGLAYAAITSAYAGTVPSQDTTQEPYSPVFTTMYTQNVTSPMFSLALQRGANAGYLALGGLPPVTVSGSWARAPILQSVVRRTGMAEYAFYTLVPDALVYGGRSHANSAQYIVDSGTTLVYLPSAVAQAVNNAFTPKAKLIASQGGYFVQCNAKTPDFGVTIGGVVFKVSAADLVYQNQRDPASGLCLTGVQDGGSGPYILGDVWMQNVVAVFDVGAAEMRFAAHSY
ncbi:acid protease [Trichodelitschia bisporula]|uniref:Acid protease n=1 Tax=Trichodelitschia bisporula TaxID=703511 RepID=A0A6G1HIM6_9PEZI|nr:acid protease [Trichodelitschia bisporula]